MAGVLILASVAFAAMYSPNERNHEITSARQEAGHSAMNKDDHFSIPQTSDGKKPLLLRDEIRMLRAEFTNLRDELRLAQNELRIIKRELYSRVEELEEKRGINSMTTVEEQIHGEATAITGPSNDNPLKSPTSSSMHEEAGNSSGMLGSAVSREQGAGSAVSKKPALSKDEGIHMSNISTHPFQDSIVHDVNTLRVNLGPDGTTGVACSTPPLVRVLHDGFDDVESFRHRVMQVASIAKDADPSATMHRNFGHNTNQEGGHEVTNINPAALAASVLVKDGAELISELWSLARRADAWFGASASRMALRCLEVITYEAGKSHSLGLHDDGSTFLTMAIPLSRLNIDFEGGAFQAERGECSAEVSGTFGDVLVWRGWDRHRVTPVTKGKRVVLVAEWWPATTRTIPMDTDAFGRPEDTVTSYQEALEYDQNAPALQYGLGNLYYNGTSGAVQSDETAAKWWQKAAVQGFADAQQRLGYLYYQGGTGVVQSNETAAEWWHKAAVQGHMDAQFSLGDLYSKGHGVVQSNETAAEWWQKAAAKGHMDAQFNLGTLYSEGHGVVQSDVTASEWWQKAAVQWQKAAVQGQVDAQYALGGLYSRGRGVVQSDKTAVKWWRNAAVQGHMDAQFNLGTLYYQGRGVVQSDKTAAKWWQKAAVQGHVEAQNNLGTMYSEGRGVVQSDVTAAKWWQKAAVQGHMDTQFNLGTLYYKGLGVVQSDKTAAMWWRKAAVQGQKDAQYTLGALYYRGRGVVQSDETATKWWRKAAAQGHEGAQQSLGVM